MLEVMIRRLRLVGVHVHFDSRLKNAIDISLANASLNRLLEKILKRDSSQAFAAWQSQKFLKLCLPHRQAIGAYIFSYVSIMAASELAVFPASTATARLEMRQ